MNWAAHFFAFESAGTDPLYASLAPCSPVPYSAAKSVRALCKDPSFGHGLAASPCWASTPIPSPATPRPAVREVIIPGDCSLRIRGDGTFFCMTAEVHRLCRSAPGEDATINQRVLAVQSLLNSIFTNFTSDASLYLVSIRAAAAPPSCGLATVRGAFPSASPTMRTQPLLRSPVLTLRLSPLRVRQYSHTGEIASPAAAAAVPAIAAQTPGGELTIGYSDHGGDTAEASWLLD